MQCPAHSKSLIFNKWMNQHQHIVSLIFNEWTNISEHVWENVTLTKSQSMLVKKASNSTPKIYRCLNCWICTVCSGKTYPIYSRSPLGNKETKQKPWSLFEYLKSLVWNAMRYPEREGELAGVEELILSQYIMGLVVRERGTWER